MSILAIFATTSALAAPVAGTVNTATGKVLTGVKDMTLYTFDQDSKGVSSCYDICATNWPPFIAPEGAVASGEYSLVKRRDGSEQWAQNGMPLYYWAKDKKAGDVNGDGINGVWHVAKP